MNRLAIAISLLGISAIFVSFEILLRPEIFNEVSPDESFSDNTDAQENSLLAPQPHDFFDTEILNINGFPLASGFYGTALFRLAEVSEDDNFVVISFPFGKRDSIHGIVTRILPKHEMSSGRLFSLIRDKIEKSIPPEDQEKISITPPLASIPGANANFYIDNQKTFPGTTFLVLRGNKKVLAFEYERKYHDAVKNSISLFLQ